jgi:hypothetical protein
MFNSREAPRPSAGGGRFAVGVAGGRPFGMAGSELPVVTPPPTSTREIPVGPAEQQSFLERQLHSLIDGVVHAVDWAEATRIGRFIIGGYSFNAGVAVGMAENPVRSVAGLLDLGKTFILADVYDTLTQPFWKQIFHPHLLNPAAYVWAKAVVTLRPRTLDFLKKSVVERDQILHELGEVMKHPLDYLGGMPERLKKEYGQKWQKFSALIGQADPRSQFEAGRICGDLLMEVLLTIVGVVTGVGAAAKVASKVPQLLKWAGILKRVEEGAVVAREASAAAKAADAAKMAREARAPRAPAPEPVEPAPAKPPPEAKPRKPPPKPRRPTSRTAPPSLPGVTADERALAASDATGPAAREARQKVVESYLENYGQEYDPATKKMGKPSPHQIEQQLDGHDLDKPITVGPPPDTLPQYQTQFQRPNGKQGSYYTDAGTSPDEAGIFGYADDGNGGLTKKVVKEYEMNPDTPYLESKCASTTDDWSVKGSKVWTNGGGTQRVIGDRAMATEVTPATPPADNP